MKHHFFSLETVIGVATGFMLLYLLGVLLNFPATMIFNLWLLSPIIIAWMVIRILKDPYTTGKTFDEYFYEDRPDLHRNGKESSQPEASH